MFCFVDEKLCNRTLVDLTPDVALLLLVADCAAISFFDPRRKVIALGHGGWRGTVGGTARKVVQKMIVIPGIFRSLWIGEISHRSLVRI
jgi:hypothetical protein